MTDIKENNDWKVTTNRFVAFFDIMGFKDMVLKKSHEEIIILLESLSNDRNTLQELNNIKIKDSTAKIGETKSFTFSDSIIFFSKDDSIDDLNKITVDCVYLIKKSLENNIPIKGAISYGKITLDVEKQIYFGQPIIDAYLLHEDLNLYSVIADHAVERRIKELNSNFSDSFFIPYHTPMKYGKVHHFILKPAEIDKNNQINDLRKLYLQVSGKPRQYIDNTLEFYNSLNSNK